jgi:hypothetical protein
MMRTVSGVQRSARDESPQRREASAERSTTFDAPSVIVEIEPHKQRRAEGVDEEERPPRGTG